MFILVSFDTCQLLKSPFFQFLHFHLNIKCMVCDCCHDCCFFILIIMSCSLNSSFLINIFIAISPSFYATKIMSSANVILLRCSTVSRAFFIPPIKVIERSRFKLPSCSSLLLHFCVFIYILNCRSFVSLTSFSFLKPRQMPSLNR